MRFITITQRLVPLLIVTGFLNACNEPSVNIPAENGPAQEGSQPASGIPSTTPASTPISTPVSTPVTTPVSTPGTTPASTPVSRGVDFNYTAYAILREGPSTNRVSTLNMFDVDSKTGAIAPLPSARHELEELGKMAVNSRGDRFYLVGQKLTVFTRDANGFSKLQQIDLPLGQFGTPQLSADEKVLTIIYHPFPSSSDELVVCKLASDGTLKNPNAFTMTNDTIQAGNVVWDSLGETGYFLRDGVISRIAYSGAGEVVTYTMVVQSESGDTNLLGVFQCPEGRCLFKASRAYRADGSIKDVVKRSPIVSAGNLSSSITSTVESLPLYSALNSCSDPQMRGNHTGFEIGYNWDGTTLRYCVSFFGPNYEALTYAVPNGAQNFSVWPNLSPLNDLIYLPAGENSGYIAKIARITYENGQLTMSPFEFIALGYQDGVKRTLQSIHFR